MPGQQVVKAHRCTRRPLSHEQSFFQLFSFGADVAGVDVGARDSGEQRAVEAGDLQFVRRVVALAELVGCISPEHDAREIDAVEGGGGVEHFLERRERREVHGGPVDLGGDDVRVQLDVLVLEQPQHAIADFCELDGPDGRGEGFHRPEPRRLHRDEFFVVEGVGLVVLHLAHPLHVGLVEPGLTVLIFGHRALEPVVPARLRKVGAGGRQVSRAVKPKVLDQHRNPGRLEPLGDELVADVTSSSTSILSFLRKKHRSRL